jgi:hypothetical protein
MKDAVRLNDFFCGLLLAQRCCSDDFRVCGIETFNVVDQLGAGFP